ncbi:MAG: c-type cytochrome [Trueperaceae bacterium]|nr:c-type cytochrome [Trueperaceae bacterium]
MDPRQHDQIAKWERRWIAASGLMSLMFVILIAYSLATEGVNIAQSASRGTPQQLLEQPIFAQPGVRATGPNAYEVSLVGQAFNWTPETVRVPVGAEITFYLTARDVIHGWQVENTNLNVEVIPGEVSRLIATFDDVGRYRVSCNEYCGIGHQNMIGWIEVVPASQLVQAEGGAAEDVAADGTVDGAAVYASNCASCHGASGAGIAGAFPPLAGHVPDLLARDGGRTYLVNALLYGLQGAIVVDGTNYNGVMPAWGNLSDAQIAAVLNHVTTLDGSDDPAFAAEEIAAERGQGRAAADVLALRQQLAIP